MKDVDQPEKLAPRTVRCALCEYDTPTTLQNGDGSKARADWRDVGRASGALRVAGVLLALALQDKPAEHFAPCGRLCRGGPAPEDGCPGVKSCAACAAFRSNT